MTRPTSAAKSKRTTEEDRATFEPMAAATRGSSGSIRRNPSTDQKKVRRQQRKTAEIEHSDMQPLTRATARTTEALASIGRQHVLAGDNAKYGLGDGWYYMASEMTDGWHWTLYDATGLDRASGQAEQFGDAKQAAIEARSGFQKGSSVNTTRANYERTDGLQLTAGDSVHKLGDPEHYTFVSYDTVTDRAVIADSANRKYAVSPDVLIGDDNISAVARLTPARQGSIHDAILGHLGGI